MATLTKAGLRRLVKLYRHGVDGTAEQLEHLVDDGSEHLASVLGGIVFDERTDKVEQLALYVEQSRRRRSLERAHDDDQVARRLIQDLASESVRVAPDRVRLEPARLAELATCRSFDWLVLDPISCRGVERRRLRALFRECRRVRSVEVEVDPSVFRLRYTTRLGKGHLRLWLHPTPVTATPLVIEWPPGLEESTPLPRAAESVPEFTPSSDPESELRDVINEVEPPANVDEPIVDEPAAPASAAPPRRTGTHPTRPVPRFFRHVFDAALDVIQ